MHVDRMNTKKDASEETKREETKGKTQNQIDQIREDFEDRGRSWPEIHTTTK